MLQGRKLNQLHIPCRWLHNVSMHRELGKSLSVKTEQVCSLVSLCHYLGDIETSFILTHVIKLLPDTCVYVRIHIEIVMTDPFQCNLGISLFLHKIRITKLFQQFYTSHILY